MIFDPDHMSVIARDAGHDHGRGGRVPGGRSPRTAGARRTRCPAIYKLGGIVTPYAGGSEGFYPRVAAPRALREEFGRNYFGVGWGADMNGFGSQGTPRGADAPEPGHLPVRVLRRRGRRSTSRSLASGPIDINTDGVAHYGLYPDWLQDVRMLAGDTDRRRRHGPRRRGIPADVGARRRHPGRALRQVAPALPDRQGIRRRLELGDERERGPRARRSAGQPHPHLALLRQRPRKAQPWQKKTRQVARSPPCSTSAAGWR